MFTGHPDISGCRAFQTGQQSEQGGLARSGSTDDGQRFTCVQPEADIVEDIETSARRLDGKADLLGSKNLLTGIAHA